jgi:predicted nucleotidyltransferase
MDFRDPLSLLGPSATVRVVRALLESPGLPLSGREVARRADLSPRGAQLALAPLVAAGLVDKATLPPAQGFMLNPDHVSAEGLLALAKPGGLLMERIASVVGQWRPPAVSVVLFGSFARGEAGPESDIDLLVVRPASVDALDPAWEHNLGQLERSVERWTGNRAEVLEYSVDDLKERDAAGAPFLRSVVSEGVTIAGKRFPTLLRSAA